MGAAHFGLGNAVGVEPPSWVYDHEVRSRRSRRPRPGTDPGHQVRRVPMRSLRRHYRAMRRAGLPAWQARDIITSVLFTGGSSAHWCHEKPVAPAPTGELVTR